MDDADAKEDENFSDRSSEVQGLLSRMAKHGAQKSKVYRVPMPLASKPMPPRYTLIYPLHRPMSIGLEALQTITLYTATHTLPLMDVPQLVLGAPLPCPLSGPSPQLG